MENLLDAVNMTLTLLAGGNGSEGALGDVRQNVQNVAVGMQRFAWPDYLVFVLMLLICVVIGVYFGFFGKPQTEAEYLVGGRNMKVFPVGMSLIASFISGISLLGIPTEIYIYGMQYVYILIGLFVMGIIFQKIYLPVFHDLKLTSTFEYLERRFSRRVRIFGSVLNVIGVCTWLPIVIYVPALAFNQVTGVYVHIVTPVVCLVCIFYTCVGGLKAVVWTDVIQTIIMVGAMILVAIKGTIDVGGLEAVWNSNLATGRIEAPDFEPDPFKRHTMWSLLIGGVIYYLQNSAISQPMCQRYLSLPNLKAANRAIWLFVFGLITVNLLCAYCGLLIFTTYQHCDPITTKLAKQKDQLLPLLVMDVVGNIPGFPGLFVAGIFSAALSSLSTGLNSLVAVILQDFYRPCFKEELSEKHKQIVMKSSVVVLGIIFVGLVFVVEKLGTVLQLTMSIGTISLGPSLALFTMGMLIPWVNATGALIGGVFGLMFMGWLTLSSQAAIATGGLVFPEKPVSTEGCTYDFITQRPPALSLHLEDAGLPEDSVALIYRLSYLWYTLIGLFVTCVVGVMASVVCGRGLQDPRDIDPALLTPMVRARIRPRPYPNQPPPQDQIILAYEPKTYKISTISSNSLPTYTSGNTAL